MAEQGLELVVRHISALSASSLALDTALGIALAVGIVHVVTLDRSLMPWIIASQTIPILAIAPMVIVVLGAVGITGLLPKAVISMYLCFFPVTVGMLSRFNTPAEDMNPEHLAAAVRDTAGEFGARVREVVGDALLEQNFPAIHAVGRAASSLCRCRLSHVR